MSNLPLIDLKNGFWPVVHLLYGISEWNFTDMLIIKGYILWLGIFTLTFPVHELSTLDWSEKWFLTCSSFTIWNIWMKLHRYVEHQRLHIFSKDRHPNLSSSWVIRPWLIWKMVVDHQRLHIVTKEVISLSISVLLLFRHYISHKITFGAPSSGGVLCSACGAFIKSGSLPLIYLSRVRYRLTQAAKIMSVRFGKSLGIGVIQGERTLHFEKLSRIMIHKIFISTKFR